MSYTYDAFVRSINQALLADEKPPWLTALLDAVATPERREAIRVVYWGFVEAQIASGTLQLENIRQIKED